jgi:alpha-galactosidase
MPAARHLLRRRSKPRADAADGLEQLDAYRCQVTEAGVLANAKALVDTGMAARGYRFVNVDGCWEGPTRAKSGKLRADP